MQYLSPVPCYVYTVPSLFTSSCYRIHYVCLVHFNSKSWMSLKQKCVVSAVLFFQRDVRGFFRCDKKSLESISTIICFMIYDHSYEPNRHGPTVFLSCVEVAVHRYCDPLRNFDSRWERKSFFNTLCLEMKKFSKTNTAIASITT